MPSDDDKDPGAQQPPTTTTRTAATNFSANQIKRGLSYDKRVPKFLQEMYAATGYRDTAGDIRRKFEHEEMDNADDDDGHRGTKGKGHKRQKGKHGRDLSEAVGDDESPVVVVVDERKHLTREQVDELRGANDAVAGGAYDMADDKGRLRMMAMGLGRIPHGIIDALNIIATAIATSSATASTLDERPLFKKRSSAAAPSSSVSIGNKRKQQAGVATVTAESKKVVKNKNLLSFDDDE